MIPVLTPDQVRDLDAAAADPTEVLIERAGHAVARVALDVLGGAYGRRVTVLAGPGNNGRDGLAAARRLEARGVRVGIVPVSRQQPAPDALPACDLLIDAAFGTGFSGVFVAPRVAEGQAVLAVDVPSGLDAATGLVDPASRVLAATVTVTFAALRPGHVLGLGPSLCGPVELADIGLDASGSEVSVLEAADVRARLPRRPRDAHKWSAALGIVAGSPGMAGAPILAAEGALRAGAGMVRLGTPGGLADGTEAVAVALPAQGWAQDALTMLARCDAFVVGPGLGASAAVAKEVRTLLGRCGLPCVVDGDALGVLGAAAGPVTGTGPRATAASAGPPTDPHQVARDEARALLRAAATGAPARGTGGGASAPTLLPGQRAVLQATARRLGADPRAVAATGRPERTGRLDLDAAVRTLAGRDAGRTVLTPHDGEYERIAGIRPGPDRIGAARALAEGTGTVVLLKGPTTVVAAPDGRVHLVTAGDERLATAGSGDVLSGVIGALLAQGLGVFDAAACGAFVHGASAVAGGRRTGLIASDLPALVADWLSQ
jgi:NAD(P)H-hydrate repair Nnr-like enzyme with NAD(P)H-hydrate dehydratase domain/NAD(P)H-hydrate repair Nnr-like enzyme with NAD(P)H-hydrate epimerase domain